MQNVNKVQGYKQYKCNTYGIRIQKNCLGWLYVPDDRLTRKKYEARTYEKKKSSRKTNIR